MTQTAEMQTVRPQEPSPQPNTVDPENDESDVSTDPDEKR